MSTANKDAIYDALVADGIVVAMMGSHAVSSEWPDDDLDFSPTPTGTADYAALPLVDPPRARITIGLISAVNDGVIDLHVDTYEITAWSLSERLVDAITARIGGEGGTLKADALHPVGARVTEAYCTEGYESFEEDNRIYRKSINCEVTWVGA